MEQPFFLRRLKSHLFLYRILHNLALQYINHSLLVPISLTCMFSHFYTYFLLQFLLVFKLFPEALSHQHTARRHVLLLFMNRFYV